MAKKFQARRSRHRPARSKHGALTLADVKWLGEHSCLPSRVIETLTERVTGSENGQSAEEGSAAPKPAPQQLSTDDTVEVRATTAAAELAKAESIPLAEVEGTGREGPSGRRTIIKADVRRVVVKRSTSA